MKKTQVILGGVALAFFLFAANAAQAAGYYIFSFQLTTYKQVAMDWNDPAGSLVYKGIVAKQTITTNAMVYSLAQAAGCAVPLPVGTTMGSYVGSTESDPDNGKVFFLTTTKTRVPGCSAPLSETIFSTQRYDDYQASEYTHEDFAAGGLKQKWWYEAVYQFRINPTTFFDLRGLSTMQINNNYATNLFKATSKTPVHGRGVVDGYNAVLFGTISAKFYTIP